MSSDTHKEKKYKLIAVLFGTLLACFLIEFLSMIWINYGMGKFNVYGHADLKIIDRNETKISAHPYLNYVNRPFYEVKEEGKLTNRHNSDGFRGNEIIKPKPKGTFRIVFLGGSAIYTTRTQFPDYAIPSLTGKILRESGYTNVEAINAGVVAYSSAENLINLQFKIFELEPDLVVHYEAINDVHNRYVPENLFHADNRGRLKRWNGEYFPWWSQSYALRLITYKLGYLQKYLFFDNYISADTYLGHTSDTFKDYSPDFYKDLLKKNTPKFFEENILSMYGMCKVRNIPFVVSTYAYSLDPIEKQYLHLNHYVDALNEMNAAIEALSKKYQIPLIEFEKKMPKTKPLWRDDVHVSRMGSMKSAEIFAAELIKLNVLKK